AFVEMSNTKEADRAIAGLNGANFQGRALNVNEARPKGQGGDGRGNGGGFGHQLREPRWETNFQSSGPPSTTAARSESGLRKGNHHGDFPEATEGNAAVGTPKG